MVTKKIKRNSMVTIIIVILCIILSSVFNYLVLPENGKRALSYIPMFWENQAGFREIQELVKNEGEDYYTNNGVDYYTYDNIKIHLPKARGSSTEMVKTDSQISFHILSTENSVQKIQKILDDKLTDSVKGTFEHTGLREVYLLNDYLDEEYTGFPLKIWFKFEDEEEIYIVYLEGTPEDQPNGRISRPGEFIWKNIKLTDNWYVCYETDERERKG